MSNDSGPAGAVRRIGVFGGTFDPFHIGHLAAAREATKAFDLDRVLFVPTGAPWQKARYSPAEDRFLMTVLGTAEDESFAVSRMEIDRDGPTYTADTMEHLRSFYGSATELLFIAGADAVLNLGSWIGLDRLARLASVVAVHRPGFDVAKLRVEPEWPPVRLLEMPGVDVSSTEIRTRVARGERVDDVVPAGVMSYIRARRLYITHAEAAGA